MAELAHYLERIDYYVEQYCNTDESRISSLAPGISRQKIEEIIKQQAEVYASRNPHCDVSSLPLKVSEEVYELYEWHNGTIEDYSLMDSAAVCMEYVSFLNLEIAFYSLQSTAVVTEKGFGGGVFLDEGGGYAFQAQRQSHEKSLLYAEYGQELGCSLTELMKDFSEALDMSLLLLHQIGNSTGNKKERLASYNRIIELFQEDSQKSYLLKWLSIEDFLSAALKC